MDEDLQFQCVHCDFVVDDLLQLDIHGALEHPLLQYKLHGAKAAPQKTAPQPVAPAPAKRFQCTWCGKCSASSSDLERHVRVHTGEKPFQCNQCDAKFSDQGDLVKHSSRHDSSLPHVCSLCKWRFATAHGLSKHCSYAHGVKLDSVPNHFECEWCSKCFASNTKLEEHKRVHAADKPFECKTCDAKFPNRGHLMKHMSRHDRSLPHVCSLCQWRFSTPKGLGAHISQAHGMKPDKMDQKVRPTREDHKINDSDPSQVQSPAKKPFRCSICGQRFPSRNAKWSHMGRHNSHLPHVCNQCGCGYDTQYGLNMHVAKFCSVFKA